VKLRDTLAEGLSPILFHYTHVNNVLGILQKDAFILHPYVGNDSEMEMGKMGRMWYMSTTRSKSGGYTAGRDFYAVLKLDGRKLEQKYKGSPLEYWTKDMRDIDRSRGNTELEDRIFSPKPTIPKASKYIEEIHVKIPDDEKKMNDYKFKAEIRRLMIAAKKRNISLYMYSNKNDFMTQNKKKAEKLDVKSLKDKDRENYPDNSRMRSKNLSRRHIGGILELIKAPADTKRLSDEANKMRHDIVYQEYYHDGIAGNIGNTIHNHAKENLPAINKVVQFMQKKRFRKPMELVKWLQNKWTREEE